MKHIDHIVLGVILVLIAVAVFIDTYLAYEHHLMHLDLLELEVADD